MLDTTKRYFFQKLVDDTFGYYRVYDALKIRFNNLTHGRIDINSSEEFWQKIINNHPDIRNKQVVKLKDFFITEWVPKLPGQVWTEEGRQNLSEGLNHIDGYYSILDKVYQVLGPIGKQKMISGGYGSVRIKPAQNSDYCTLLNLVHVNDWHCDFGIPIVVSKSVYEQFIRYREHEGAPWIEELTGILYLDEDVPNINKVSNAIGAKLDAETIDILSTQSNLRKAFIYVSSPLDLKIRYNGSCPEAVAWTLFKTTLSNEPLRLTYSRFDPKKEDSILEAVGFITQYVANFDGETMLTDFDGVQRRLLATSSLTNPQMLTKKHNGTLTLIDRWIEHEKNGA
jgi:hypothetical protein